MGKLTKNESGFSVVEVVLVLIIVALIGVVGFMVYKNHTKTTANTGSANTTKATTATSTKTAAPVDPYAGWQSYSDSHVSFKYPSGWQTGKDDRYVTVGIGVTSPDFTSAAFTTADNPGAPVTFSLQISSNSSTVYCNYDACTVTALTPISNAQLPNSSLAVVNQTSANGTHYSQYVVVPSSTKVGDTTITAVSAGTSGVYVFGQPDYMSKAVGTNIAARISDTSALQADSHFKDLINLINSIKFN